MTTRITRLPYGVGRFTSGLYILLAVLLAVVAWGIYAYSRQIAEGLAVTGLRDIGTMGGVPWGLYIAFDVYFVGISFAGITIAALIRIFNLEQLKPVSRMAELLTIVSLILAAFCILPDLGQPVRGIVNLFRYARPQSPFFGTFTLVIAGYLFASLVYLYLDGRRDAALLAQSLAPEGGALQRFYRLWAAGYRDTPAERDRHHRASVWLAVAIVPLLVTAHSTLGLVFGLQTGRPGWYSALQAPAFVVMAGVSGIGLLAVIAAIFRHALAEREQLSPEVFRWLGSLLIVLIVVYLYLMVVELLTPTYAGHHHEAWTTQALLTGSYAWLFWTGVGSLIMAFLSLVPPFLPELTRLRFPEFRPVYTYAAAAAVVAVSALSAILRGFAPETAGSGPLLPVARLLPWALALLLLALIVSLFPLFSRSTVASTVTAGLLVNVAAILKRFLIVVPSQTHGMLLPYGIGTYTPTWVEYSIIAALFALGALLYALFAKVFPIMEAPVAEKGGQ